MTPHNNTKNLHSGQLKLLLSELQFMTLMLKNNTDSALIVYAGSAPSFKAPIKQLLFPNVKWLYIDPLEHLLSHNLSDIPPAKVAYFKTVAGNRFAKADNSNIVGWHENKFVPTRRELLINGALPSNFIEIIENNDYNFYIYENLMTDEIARQLKSDTLPIYFISDIRTAEGAYVSDYDILWNTALTFNWLNEMKGNIVSYQIKFRPPYGLRAGGTAVSRPEHEAIFARAMANGIDYIADYNNNKFRFFDNNDIYLQCYPRGLSNEMRLVSNKWNIVEYDMADWERRAFYYNTVMRPRQYPLQNRIKLIVDNCADCARMYKIFDEYRKKYNMAITFDEFIKHVIGVLGHVLHRNKKLII